MSDLNVSSTAGPLDPGVTQGSVTVPEVMVTIPLVNPTDPTEPVQEMVVPKASIFQLGSLLGIDDIDTLLSTVQRIALEVANIIESQKMYEILERTSHGEIKRTRHVRLEGWQTLNAFLGLTWKERGAAYGVWGETDGWEAAVGLVRLRDGLIIGEASAMCTRHEGFWKNQEEFARRSMAVTRACSRVTRLNFGWILKMVGYEILSAEELTDEMRGEGAERIPMAPKQPAAGPVASEPAVVDEAKQVKNALIEYAQNTFGWDKQTTLANLRATFPTADPKKLIMTQFEWLRAGLDALQKKQDIPTSEEIEAQLRINLAGKV